MTLTAYVASLLIARETIGYFAVVAPLILLSTIIGTRLYAMFSEAIAGSRLAAGR